MSTTDLPAVLPASRERQLPEAIALAEKKGAENKT